MSDFDFINNFSPFSDEFRRAIVDIGRRAGEGEVAPDFGESSSSTVDRGGSSIFLAKLTDSKLVDTTGSDVPQRFFYKWEEWPFGGRKSTGVASDGGGNDDYRFGAINTAEIGNPIKPATGVARGTYGVKVGTVTSGSVSSTVELLPVAKSGGTPAQPDPVVIMFAFQRGVTVEGVTDKVHFFFNAANSVEVTCGS